MGPALRDFWPTASPFDGRGAILSAEKKSQAPCDGACDSIETNAVSSFFCDVLEQLRHRQAKLLTIPVQERSEKRRLP